jgi:hypothetical protein
MEDSLRNDLRILIVTVIAAGAITGCQRSRHVQPPGMIGTGNQLRDGFGMPQSATQPIAPSTVGTCGALNDPTTEVMTAQQCAASGRTFLPGVQPYQNMFLVSA